MRWENRLPCRSRVLGNSDGPEEIVPPKVEPNSDLNIGQNNPNFNLTNQQRINLRQRVSDTRALFPNKKRNSGNVAVANVNIDGLQTKTLSASSGIDEITPSNRVSDLVGEGSGNFKSQVIPNKSGVPINRDTDSEFKILDNLADQLGNNTQARGNVTIFTERAACNSCLDVADQFGERFPNINVRILDNDGRTIKVNTRAASEARSGQ